MMGSISSSSGGMRFHQIERLLAEHGFAFVRQRGSHRHFVNARGQRITVVVHGGAHTALSRREVAAVRRDLARLGAGAAERAA